MQQIPGFPQYTIDELGNVRHFKRGLKKWTISVLGYPIVTLTYPDPTHKPRQKTFTVANLMALTYIPNPNGLPEVNHIDGNKMNHSIENLEWTDRVGNIVHSIETGLRKNLKRTVYKGKAYYSARQCMRETGVTWFQLKQINFNDKSIKKSKLPAWFAINPLPALQTQQPC